jgi:hypothetical protein
MKKFIVFSPDGFTLEFEPKEHDSIERARAEILSWKQRFKAQGYYSSNSGRIPFDDIQDYCRIQEIVN